jgi:hypothetical protein
VRAESNKKPTVQVSEIDAMHAATNFIRARGTALCNTCNREYKEHPVVGNVRNWQGQPYLNQLCDTTFVKLGE